MPTHPRVGDRLPDGSYFVDMRFSQFLLFHPGEPMVTQDDMYRLPREMQELHDKYMNVASSGADLQNLEIRVRVPKHYGFFDSNMGEIEKENDVTFGIDFLDLFHLFNRKCLNNAILRLWCVHYTREAYRVKQYGMAIADPLLFNATLLGPDPLLAESRRLAIEYLTQFILKHRDHHFIMILYHLHGHWVTIAICLDMGGVTYFDTLRRKGNEPQRDFGPIKYVIDSAYRDAVKWYEMTGFSRNPDAPLRHNFNFPCEQQPEGSVSCGYYCAHTIQQMINDFKPKGKKTFKEVRNWFLANAELGHNSKILVYEIQKDIGEILNKEVLKSSKDYYGGGIVTKSG